MSLIMALFGLDAECVQRRSKTAGGPVRSPGPAATIWRGIWGFTIVGLIGFAPWAIIEHWFRSLREGHLYLASVAAFIAASGPFLHPLILGPGSLMRCYKVFTLGFGAYSIAWIGLWVTLRGQIGEALGLVAGGIAMASVICLAFDAWRRIVPVAVALLAGSAGGYYLGDWIYHRIHHDHRYLAMAIWGICYGAGFGAGLGAAFYLAQSRTRSLLAVCDKLPVTL
ncbi:MAG: hypothetical protein ACKV19_17205 [Verrucomicrobiales bacterium]